MKARTEQFNGRTTLVLSAERPEEDGFMLGDKGEYETHKFDNGYCLYFAEAPNGFVRYFAHVPTNETGFRGRVLRGVHKATGLPFEVKGAWASRSSVMNMFFKNTFEVTLIKTNGIAYSTAMTLDALRQVISDNGLDIEIVRDEEANEVAYKVVEYLSKVEEKS